MFREKVNSSFASDAARRAQRFATARGRVKREVMRDEERKRVADSKVSAKLALRKMRSLELERQKAKELELLKSVVAGRMGAEPEGCSKRRRVEARVQPGRQRVGANDRHTPWAERRVANVRRLICCARGVGPRALPAAATTPSPYAS